MNRTNKIFFAVNIVIFLMLLPALSVFFLSSCSTGGLTTTPGTPGQNPTMKFLASNVLFRPAVAVANQETVSDQVIYADQIIVNTANNSLQSDNLQTAIDNELAPDLATILPGTWETKFYKGNQVLEGTITFNTNGTWLCDNQEGMDLLSISWGREGYRPICKTYTIDDNNIIKIVFDRYNVEDAPPGIDPILIENEIRYIPVININPGNKLTVS